MSIKSPHLTHPKYRPDIDGLRAIAILSVVFFHAFPWKFPGGFIGVDIFFVISGYLISTIIFSSLEKNRFSILEFYIRRIRRIFPALIFVLIMCLLFGCYVLLAGEYQQLGKHVMASASFVQNFVLYGESGYFDSDVETKPLLHLWSLAIEEQFYMFWPLLLSFVWGNRWGFLKVTLTIILLSFTANIYLLRADPSAAFYFPISRFWELMIGGVLAYIALHFPRVIESHKEAQSILGFFLILLSLVLLNKTRDFPGWWALLPTVGSFLIISAGESAWLNKNVLSNRLMLWFGLISYPLYLWHWPLLSFSQILQSGNASPLIRVIAVLVAIGFAWLTYRFIEIPIRAKAKNRQKVVIWLVIVLLMIGFIGYQIHSNSGFPSRGALENINQTKTGESPKLSLASCDQLGVSADSADDGLHCKFAKTSSHISVAVYGDSHAESAFLGIADLLQKHSINTLMLASWGCPLYLDASVGNTKLRKAQCILNAQNAMKAVVGNREVNKVFIVSRGPYYFTGKDYGRTHDSIVFKPPSLDLKQYVASLQGTIDIFYRAGKKVYYIAENPELGFSPGFCTSRPFRITHEECVLHRETVLRVQRQYLEAISQLRNVVIVETLDKFCPSDKCLIVKGNELLYNDSNHLSAAGSKFQAESIENYLLE